MIAEDGPDMAPRLPEITLRWRMIIQSAPALRQQGASRVATGCQQYASEVPVPVASQASSSHLWSAILDFGFLARRVVWPSCSRAQRSGGSGI